MFRFCGRGCSRDEDPRRGYNPSHNSARKYSVEGNFSASTRISGPPQVLFELLERLRQVLAAEADAERVEPVPVEGSRQEQDSRLLDQIGAEFVNRPPEERRERDGSRPRATPVKQIPMGAEEGVETIEVVTDCL
jgi:hypothetical protein